MKKILFLTASYPNMRRSASVLCTHRVMECVAASGKYEVFALCFCFSRETDEEILNGIHIYRLRPSLWTQLRSRIIESRKHHRLERIVEVVQKVLTIPFYPQTEPLTFSRFYNAAMKLHRKECFDMVVSEHHGLVTLLTGCRLMRNYHEIKHVAILWDPVKGQITTSCLPSFYTGYRIEVLEKYVAKYTTLQISTLSMKEYHKLNGDYALNHRLYLDIPGILSPEPEVPTVYMNYILKGAINIVFSGLLSDLRNPLPIISLLGKCEMADRINIVFFSMGAMDIVNEAAINFKGSIIYHDYIPLNELHTIYRHADFLLNVSHINAKMTPSKIFEYMSYGKPIISTYVTDGDSAQNYISRYAEGICIDLKRTETENVALLNAFLGKEHRDVPFEEVKELFKENTPERFLEVIDDLIGD